MPNMRHIALLVLASRAYGRGICLGVAASAMERGDWLIYPHERSEFKEMPGWLKRSRLDGIIAYIPTVELGRQLMGLNVPIVDVHGQGNCPTAPVLDTDPEQVARLAADFFRQAGFIHFGFCGYPGIFFSDRRSEAFERLLNEAGHRVEIYSPPPKVCASMDVLRRERGALEYEAELSAWLVRVPKPIAILACNDIRGQQVINACRTLGISMPDDVSVIGVDNDEIICRLCQPTLTSIAPDYERLGRMAVDMLARMIDGQEVEPRLWNLPPSRIVERESTDITTAQHPIVLSASRIIRSRANANLSVEQICSMVGCSRSTLDNLFRKHLGRPVAREMLRVRLNRCRRLLEDTDQTVDEIARKCGFLSSTYFCRFFKRETGLSPSMFRAEHTGK
ncbi:XylR family transcriptional regulator [Geothrix sp. PMB-07]|uniref:XylR family transcriptional regulator n=1 Tax=Geothrix sp. PMB-07 TaxID=3068640 RepID=UPI002741E736|nr:XylR family transcriptional regulator [Geothrix sp. PMB-07]WLT32363.1 XylR family transcriptional regulator [Geothrix sp. PMB-07]